MIVEQLEEANFNARLVVKRLFIFDDFERDIFVVIYVVAADDLAERSFADILLDTIPASN